MIKQKNYRQDGLGGIYKRTLGYIMYLNNDTLAFLISNKRV